VRHDVIELVLRGYLTRPSALLLIAGDERLDRVFFVDTKVALRILDRTRQKWQVFHRDLPKPVLEPADLDPSEMLDQSTQRGLRWHEPATRVLLRDTAQLGFNGIPAVVEERFERGSLVGNRGDLASVEDVRHQSIVAGRLIAG
jgi:hypothetical protein